MPGLVWFGPQCQVVWTRKSIAASNLHEDMALQTPAPRAQASTFSTRVAEWTEVQDAVLHVIHYDWWGNWQVGFSLASQQHCSWQRAQCIASRNRESACPNAQSCAQMPKNSGNFGRVLDSGALPTCSEPGSGSGTPSVSMIPEEGDRAFGCPRATRT